MSAGLPLTDSHAHLTSKELAPDAQGVLARARDAGVGRILTVSVELGDPERVVEAAERGGLGSPEVWAAVGVHPHEASGWSDDRERELLQWSTHPRVLAVGEMGLDYHYEHSPRDAQHLAFRRQVRVARAVGKPLVIHTREAEEDTAEILESEGAAEVGGVLHCFTSSWWLAERGLELGFAISFSGIVTFKNADELREVARRVPADRLLVETDCPYLAPVPHRGEWPNEPSRVRVTAEFLAELRGVTFEELARTTSENFERVFRPPT